MLRAELFEILHRGLIETGLLLDRQTEPQFIRYIELVSQWNKVFKLSSIHDLDSMITHHLLDSLPILPYINGRTIFVCLITANSRKKIQFF